MGSLFVTLSLEPCPITEEERPTWPADGRRRGGVNQPVGVQSKVDSSHAGLINKTFLLILKMKVHELCISDVLACRS